MAASVKLAAAPSSNALTAFLADPGCVLTEDGLLDQILEALAEQYAELDGVAIDKGVFLDEAEAGERLLTATREKLTAALARLVKEAEDRAELDRMKAEAAAREHALSVMQHITACGNGMIGGQTYPYVILIRELEEKVVIDETFGDLREQAETLRASTLATLREAMQREADESARKSSEAAAEKARQEERAKADAEAAEKVRAAEAEVQRLRDEAAAKEREEQRQRDEQAARERDQKHRTKITNEAAAALVRVSGVMPDQAEKIVAAIKAGDVPHVRIQF